jgi:type II secretory pathway predicted ATPase ExeA
MYEAFFGLNRRPFSAVPHAEQYFAAAATETARTALSRCIERAEGIAVVIGPSGTGKTLLCKVLAAQFAKKLRVALLSGSRFGSRRALFQAILFELGKPYRGLDEGEARLAITELLTDPEACPAGMLLIVDEAYTMPLRLVDEVRMLTDIARRGQPQVRLVLAGGSVLEERLANPKLESLSQRITARTYLEALPRNETVVFVQTRINLAGGNGPRVFSDESCHAIHRATDGVPRLVNQVSDHAMLLSFSRGQRAIEPSTVEEAWADLQQLPTPWNDEPKPAQNVVEFGELDDLADEATFESDDATPAEPAVLRPFLNPAESFLDDDEDAAIRSEQGVDRIETMLGEVDDQFRPTANAPEVELLFDDPHHPFSQRFEQEEFVADRYAKPQRATIGAFAARRRIDSNQTAEEPETFALRPQDDSGSPLIIEEGYDHAATGSCRVAPVRQHEYAQLFSRLRRDGS